MRLVNVRFRSSNKDPFPPGQTWTSAPSQIDYRDETSEVVQHYEQAMWEANAPMGTIVSYADISGEGSQSAATSVTTFDYVPSSHSCTGIIPTRSPTIETRLSGFSHPTDSPQHSQLGTLQGTDHVHCAY